MEHGTNATELFAFVGGGHLVCTAATPPSTRPARHTAAAFRGGRLHLDCQCSPKYYGFTTTVTKAFV